MYNQPFFMPGFSPYMMAQPMTRGMMGAAPLLGRAGSLGAAGGAARGAGLIRSLGNGIAGLRSINWSGLINGTSKTLGVINQTIPLVKQVGPVMNNMKSMLRVASAFKDETDRSYRRNSTHQKQNISRNSHHVSNSSSQVVKNYSPPQEKVESSHFEDYSPTFFVQS